MMFSKDSKWAYVINLSNGIIGVSVLTMPFCLEQCGIVLGTLLLLATNLLTRLTCQLLIKSAHMVRRRSYEQLAFHTYGNFGKTFVEVSMILFTKSTLVAFFVVIGDLGPMIFADFFGVSVKTESFRVGFIVFLGLFVILPLSLLKTLDSLSHISSLAVLFYGFLVFRLFLLSLPNLFSWNLWNQVNYWRFEGVMQCLPIFALSLSCQTQLFVIYNEMPESSPAKMDSVVGGAVHLCSAIYLAVGLFGYSSFYDKSISGDILVFLEGSALTQFIKMGFLLSVAVSYPLMIFPCRAAIYSMLFKQESPNQISEFATDLPIPQTPLKLITLFLVTFNMLVAVIIPNVELILGLSGSLIGSIICFVIPAVLFLTVASPSHVYLKLVSQISIVIGLFMLIFCTYATLQHHQYVPPPVVSNEPVATTVPTTAFTSTSDFTLTLSLMANVVNGKKVERANSKEKEDVLDARQIVENLRVQQVEQQKLVKEQKELLEEIRKLKEPDKNDNTNNHNKFPRHVDKREKFSLNGSFGGL